MRATCAVNDGSTQESAQVEDDPFVLPADLQRAVDGADFAALPLQLGFEPIFAGSETGPLLLAVRCWSPAVTPSDGRRNGAILPDDPYIHDGRRVFDR